MSAAAFGHPCEETPIATRLHLITGACLLSTGLVLGGIDGAVATAEPDGPAASDSILSGDDDSTTSTTTTATTSADDDDDDDGTAQHSHPAFDREDEDDDEDELLARSPSFAQAEPDDDDLWTDTTTATSSVLLDIAAPATTVATTHETKAGGNDAPAPVAPTAPTPAAAMSTALDSAPVPVSEPAPAPDIPITQEAAAPAPAGPAPKAAPVVVAPGLGAAVAYLLGTLVSVTVVAVNAIVELVAELRITVGLPWASQPGGDIRTPSALLPHSAIMVLLEKMMSRSLSESGKATMLGNAVAGGSAMDTIRSLSSSLQPAALALTGIELLDCVSPGAVQGVITALAAMSLWALLSAALPGLGGLFAFAATGVRLGYRQARAGIGLPATAFARFAGAGPIGVVRTGSVIAVHTRAPAPIPAAPARRLGLVS